ncbi:hypothetical protein L6164_018592 [Bauhinia variegata]|uniref:Uncharacterized protein n=1 Tax=Bauhinia variegata TaxID=167791 RepID=A0ACB9NC74_BAUVA|nr:hypothetical protein L6164_018592 [Bauhinia variegata]
MSCMFSFQLSFCFSILSQWNHVIHREFVVVGLRGLLQNIRNEQFSKTEDHGDIISNLPEDIISRILSFIPTKDAVRTSVLSRSLVYMWTSVTNLYLDDRAKNESFMKFVEGVLVHVNAPTICSFTLLCKTTYDACRLNSWISSIKIFARHLKKFFFR